MDVFVTKTERPAVFAGVPSMRLHFVGRDKDVVEIVSLLTGEASSYVAVVGMPGVGKSTLATALAHHRTLLEQFKDGVLWASVGPPKQADVMTTLAAWGNALGADLIQLNEPETRREAVKQLVGDRAMVVVLDDIWDWEQAQTLLCGGPHCVHLLTTRDLQIARKFAGEKLTYPLKILPDTEAKKLLEAIAPEVCAAYPVGINRLVGELDGLPLSLELVGSFLASDERNLFPDLFGEDKPLEEVDEPVERLALMMESDKPGAKRSLTDILKLSLDHLPSEAATAFYELGAFAPTPASFSLPAAEYVTRATKGTLALLATRSLIEVEGQRMFLHQTLAELARTQMPPEAQIRHREFYLALANQDQNAWKTIEPEYEQITWGFQQNPDDESVLDWVWALYVFQSLRGLRKDQIVWIERGLVIANRENLKEDRGVLLNHMGGVYDNLDQRAKALETYKQALQIFEEVGVRGEVAKTLNNIGLMYDRLGEPVEALKYLTQVLPVFKEVGDWRGFATTLNNIGLAYQHLGYPAKALEYFKQAEVIHQEVGNRIGLATALNNMGWVYDYYLSQQPKALETYLKVLPILEEVGDRGKYADTLNNIGLVYDHMDNPTKALEFYAQGLPIFEELSNRFMFASSLSNIALVHNNLGYPAEALEHFKQALPIFEEVDAGNSLATTLHYIGAIYDNLDQREKAKEYYEKALPIRKKVGNRDGLTTTLTNLGVVYANLDQREKAIEYFEEALPIYKELGDQAGLATTLNKIGWTYENLGHLEKAIEYYEQALPNYEEVEDWGALATTLNRIGLLYDNLGDQKRAMEAYERSLSFCLESKNQYQEGITRFNIAFVFHAQGRLPEAIEQMQKVVELERLIQHPDLEGDTAKLHELEAELAAKDD